MIMMDVRFRRPWQGLGRVIDEEKQGKKWMLLVEVVHKGWGLIS